MMDRQKLNSAIDGEMQKRITELNELANKYVQSGQGSERVSLYEQIYVLMFTMERFLFSSKRIKTSMEYTVGGLYDRGEFIHEALLYSFPSILDSYEKRVADPGFDPDTYPFSMHFNTVFPSKLIDHYRIKERKLPHDLVLSQRESVPVFLLPSKNHPSEFYVKTGDIKTVKGRIHAGDSVTSVLEGIKTTIIADENWYRIEYSSRLRTAYVSEKDVRVIPASAGSWPEAEEGEQIDLPNPTSVTPEETINAEPFQKHILILLGLMQKLFSRKRSSAGKENDPSLSKYDCFRMFFTEALVKLLKETTDLSIYVDRYKEEDTIREADEKFMDYILVKPGKSYNAIVMTPLKKYACFGCTCRLYEGELEFPLSYDLFARFLEESRMLARSRDSLKVSLSNCWGEFSNLYDLLGRFYHSNDSEQLAEKIEAYAYNQSAAMKERKTRYRSSREHDAACPYCKP